MAYSIVSARTKGWNGPWFRRKGVHNGLEHVVLRRRLRAMCQKRVPRIKCVPEKFDLTGGVDIVQIDNESI